MLFFSRIIDSVYIRLFRLLNSRAFNSFGRNVSVLFPLKIDGTKNISIGDSVVIAYKTWLAALPHTGEESCELIIGKGSRIGNFNHIYATKSIRIGENVLTADKVYISDNLHEFKDIDTPIMYQEIKQISPVVIGNGTWLGENVCIIGASIGENCVIGANSVVTKNIPNYCVAVGAPAKIIKKFNIEHQKWMKNEE